MPLNAFICLFLALFACACGIILPRFFNAFKAKIWGWVILQRVYIFILFIFLLVLIVYALRIDWLCAFIDCLCV
jgi:hypothetical protein